MNKDERDKQHDNDLDRALDNVELKLDDLEYVAGGAAHFPNLTVRPDPPEENKSKK